jgi:hypothetical protein
MEWDTTKTQNTIKSYVSYHCSQFKTHKGDTKHNLQNILFKFKIYECSLSVDRHVVECK